MSQDPNGRLPRAFTTPGSSSFIDFLAAYAPDLLPGSAAGRAPMSGTYPGPGGHGLPDLQRHGI